MPKKVIQHHKDSGINTRDTAEGEQGLQETDGDTGGAGSGQTALLEDYSTPLTRVTHTKVIS